MQTAALPAAAEPRLVSLTDAPELVYGCAKLLARQWPAQSATSRQNAFATHLRKAKPGEVPCHLVLVDGETETVVGHCRLQRACENADGFSAAITSVVVEPDRRGSGLGRALLHHAEATAAAMGFGYLYLWTHDAQGFYLACGYTECEKVSLLKPALASLGSAAVNKLEALFAKKASSQEGGGGGGGGDEAEVRADSTWFRKRLLEQVASRPLSHAELLDGVRDALRAADADGADGPTIADDGLSTAAAPTNVAEGDGAPANAAAAGRQAKASGEWALHVTAVRWERQVGPCCGLAALRMARSALRGAPTPPSSPQPPPEGVPAPAPMPPAATVAEAAVAEAGTKATDMADNGHVSTAMGGAVELSLDGDAAAPYEASLLQAALERGFTSDGESNARTPRRALPLPRSHRHRRLSPLSPLDYP